MILCPAVSAQDNVVRENQEIASREGGLVMKASTFGIRSDGVTMNTNSIQKAIDYIHENGGGTLEFYVGRYLTGPVELKSNVYIHLYEGAILVGSKNPYDYMLSGKNALVGANFAENIGIIGKGVIEGGGKELVYNIINQVHAGILKDNLNADRPGGRPRLLRFFKCKNLRIEGITLTTPPGFNQEYLQCEDVVVDRETVMATEFWNNDGINIWDCRRFKLLNSYVNSADDAINLVSDPGDGVCEDVEIRNCIVRSSANGLKFGSNSWGTYRNIKFINCKVYDTFRSAVNFASPDGALIENVVVDSLYATHVGHGIIIRLNKRDNKEKIGIIRGVTIKNSFIEVCAEKPDYGYGYEGPVEDNPRNISPCEIMGIPGRIIEDVTISNVHIVHPGGGDRFYAYRGTSPEELDAIPEYEDMYPDFSKFKELPAWGFFIRHARGLKFENVTMTAGKKDYRPSFVLVDVKDSSFKKVKIEEPDSRKKDQYIQYKTEGIKIVK